jgi:heme/copper-type cytochrome/quinol oxidase subunit 3
MCWAGWAAWSESFAELHKSILRKSTLDATAYYWHFMDGLWVYLLLLLWMKL